MDSREQPKPSEQVAMMLRGILTAEGEAIGCEDCFELLDRCADLAEAGQPLDQIYPEVKKHLDDCVCCSHEFEALLSALGALPPSTEEPASG